MCSSEFCEIFLFHKNTFGQLLRFFYLRNTSSYTENNCVLKPVFIVTETVAWRCSLKEVFLDFHKNHSKTLVTVSFCLVKLQDLACPTTLVITCTSLVFSAKFSEYFRDSYSIKHLRKVASTAKRHFFKINDIVIHAKAEVCIKSHYRLPRFNPANHQNDFRTTWI